MFFSWWRNRKSNRKLGQQEKQRRRRAGCKPWVEVLEDRLLLATVGYLDDRTYGTGNADYITAAGHTPVQLTDTDLASYSLGTLDALIIGVGNYDRPADLLANYGAVLDYVNNGGRLILHDSNPGANATQDIVPGLDASTFVGLTGSDQVNVLDTSSALVNGLFGVVDDSTLDGGNWSTHGHVESASLPPGVNPILGTEDNPDHVAVLSYPYGGGFVIYTTIPAEYYTNGEGVVTEPFATNLVSIYLRNELNAALTSPVQPMPSAHAGGPYAVSEGGALELDASNSSDPSGRPLNYSWDINGDGLFDDAVGVNPTLTWAQLEGLGVADGPGTFSIRVRVTNDLGHVGWSIATTLTVSNAPPAAAFGNNGPIGLGDPVTVSFTGPSDPAAADVAAGFSYSYDFNDNGSFSDPGEAEDTAEASWSYTFDNPGVYTVHGRIKDKDGGFTDYTTLVVIGSAPPALDNVTATSPVNEGDTVTLSGDLSAPGAQGTVSLEVDWGDGTTETFTYGAGTLAFSETHRYLDDNPTATPSDSYTISLQLSADTGSATASASVEVNNVTPTLGDVVVTSPIAAGGTATLTGTITDPGTGDTFTLQIDWADGSAVELLDYPSGTSSFSAMHLYAAANPDGYPIVLTLTDDDGGVTIGGATVIVASAPNTAPELDDSGDMILDPIDEDQADNPGTLVTDLVASAGGDRITDMDTGAVEGIAVIGLESSNGIWQFSTDGGQSWIDFGSPSETEARLLAADENSRIRFLPNLDFNGTAEITFRAWDRTSGTNGETADVTTNGGQTPFSITVETARVTVRPVNDAPIFNSPGDQVFNQVNYVGFSATATDPDGDVLDYWATGLPTGLAIDPDTGYLSGELEHHPPATYLVTVTASDGSNAASITFQLTTVIVLGTGQGWSDEYTGNPGTVYVYNSGPGTVWVSPGTGSAALSPYDGTMIIANGPTGPGTSSAFSVSVEGQNGYAGDASWSGDVSSLTFSATGDIASISISGDLTVSAGGNIGDLSGANVSATAGGDIVSVTASASVGFVIAGESIGAVMAGLDIGEVTAGRNVAGDLTAGGNIGDVTAGIAAGGSIGGVIIAGGNIGNLTAYGLGGQDGSPSTLPSPATGLDDPWLWRIDPENDLYAHGSLPEERIGRPDIANGGNITQSVAASGDIGKVIAFGRIDGSLTAGGSIGYAPDPYTADSGVWALEQIAGDITAGNLGLVVQSWQGIGGDVSAPGDLSAWAYDSIAGDLTSTEGRIRVGSWYDVNGGADAYRSVDVRAFHHVGAGAVAKAVLSETEWVRVYAGQDVGSRVEAEQYVAVYAGGSITSDMKSRTEDVWAEAGEDISTGTVWAHANTWLTALGGNLQAVVTAETGRAKLWADGDVEGSIIAYEDADVYALGSVAAAVTSNEATVDVWAMENVSGQTQARWYARVEAGVDLIGNISVGDQSNYATAHVKAGRDLSGSIWASGDVDAESELGINGEVVALWGNADLFTHGSITRAVTAGWQATLWAWEDITGNVTAGDSTTWSNAYVWAHGVISGNVWASGNADVEADGNITGNVTAYWGSADVAALGSVTGDIYGGLDARVLAWDEVSGDIWA